MSYQKIKDYGIIGNMRTAALIGINGSIDWMCFPHFDSPSIFGRILDENRGGYFQIVPIEENVTQKQFYWPETNVLITRFLCSDGVCEVVDYMPVGDTKIGEHENRLVRWVKAVRGTMKLKIECKPAFNYAQDEYKVVLNSHGAGFYSKSLSMGLATSVPLETDGSGVFAEIEMKQGDTANYRNLSGFGFFSTKLINKKIWNRIYFSTYL